MEGSLVAYKVFTNGSVLQASEINDNLMRQSVMVFSNAAARTAAITSPIEGMVSYLEDVDRYDHYNGTSWFSPFGLTHINTTDFTAQTSVTVNNVFSAAYNNYAIELQYTQNTSAGGLTYTLVNGGTPAASNWGYNTLLQYGLGTFASDGASAQASPTAFATNAGETGYVDFRVKSPFLTTRSYAFAESLTTASGNGANDAKWQHAVLNNATSYEGFRITASAGTITGTLRFYGLRNA